MNFVKYADWIFLRCSIFASENFATIRKDVANRAFYFWGGASCAKVCIALDNAEFSVRLILCICVFVNGADFSSAENSAFCSE